MGGHVVTVLESQSLDLVAIPELPVAVTFGSEHVVQYLWEDQTQGFLVVPSLHGVEEIVYHTSVCKHTFFGLTAPTEDHIRHVLHRHVRLFSLLYTFTL